MTNFWADKLAATTPAPPAAPLPARDTWWGSDIYTRDHRVPQAPEKPAEHQPAAAGALPSRAQHLRQNGTCPSCGGSDYYRATPSTVQMCYSCGYPVQHSTSGLGSPNASTPGRAALGQVRGSGFQPHTIVGRVDSV
ncbi:hypothetical protein ACFVGM_08725 [Kitasatospora purpeofusca]|uniref:hypothetical protein n=1 Tax=Kitasatospora purpeofusca TaxID=67352 RepID=UPI0036B3BD66